MRLLPSGQPDGTFSHPADSFQDLRPRSSFDTAGMAQGDDGDSTTVRWLRMRDRDRGA